MENRRVVGVIIFDDALDYILNNGGPQPSLIEPIEVKAKIKLYCLIFETKLLDVEAPLNFARPMVLVEVCTLSPLNICCKNNGSVMLAIHALSSYQNNA